MKFGALATACGFDWDGDGDDDIIAGNTAGYIAFIENLGDGRSWAAPQKLQAGGQTIRIQAGPNGSIQGPAEAKWGYTSPYVADWDADRAEAYTHLCNHVHAGEIKVDTETVPLADIEDAWQRQKSSPHRKLVLVP